MLFLLCLYDKEKGIGRSDYTKKQETIIEGKFAPKALRDLITS